MKSSRHFQAAIFTIIVGSIFIALLMLFNSERSAESIEAQKPAPSRDARVQSSTIDTAELNLPPATKIGDGEERRPVTATDLASYNALATSKDPRDRFAAYNILRSCNELQRSIELSVHLPRDGAGEGVYRGIQEKRALLERSECRNLPYSKAAERVRLVKSSADAGVPGAAAALYIEGPNGHPIDLEIRPTDLNVNIWFKEVTVLLTRDAESGDLESSLLLAQVYSMGPPAFRDGYLSALYETLGFQQMLRNQVLSDRQKKSRQQGVDLARGSLTPSQLSAIDQRVEKILLRQ